MKAYKRRPDVVSNVREAEMKFLKGTEIQDIQKRMVRFQQLTRNLFLTLHGHNAHRQQRQLSKFLMHYQQFASHVYYGAAGPVSKMASQQEKAFCVLRFFLLRPHLVNEPRSKSEKRTAGRA
jgi:hypothetical protein